MAMIKNQNIIDHLRRQPFLPFEIRTSDGRVYAVDHPEFLAITHQGNVIHYVTDDDRLITIAVSQIVSLETRNSPQAA